MKRDGNSLVLDEVGIEDDGVYTCKADNPYGSATHDILLTVTGLEAPKVVTRQEDQQMLSGDKVMLTCVVTGKPLPTVYWTKGNEKIEPTHGTNLVLEDVSAADAGDYVCHAFNPAGDDRTVLHLDIHTPPTIETQSKTHVVLEGDALELSCPCTGQPEPVLSWEKNGEQVKPSDNIILTKKSLCSGFFFCDDVIMLIADHVSRYIISTCSSCLCICSTCIYYP